MVFSPTTASQGDEHSEALTLVAAPLLYLRESRAEACFWSVGIHAQVGLAHSYEKREATNTVRHAARGARAGLRQGSAQARSTRKALQSITRLAVPASLWGLALSQAFSGCAHSLALASRPQCLYHAYANHEP